MDPRSKPIKRLNFRIDEQQHGFLTTFAQQYNTSVSEVIRYAIGLLEEQSQQVFLPANGNIKRTESDRALSSLILALGDDKLEVRQQAISGLVLLGSLAVPALVVVIEKETGNVNGWAAIALGKFGDTRAVPGLISALKRDQDGLTRVEAIETLSQIEEIGEHAQAAVSALIDVLRDAEKLNSYIFDSDVCHSAQAVLTRIGSPAVPKLIKVLCNEEEDELVRSTMAATLGLIGDVRAVPALIGALSDESSEVRYYAACALGCMRETKAVPALIKALDDENSEVRTEAEKGLEKIGTPAARHTKNGALKKNMRAKQKQRHSQDLTFALV